MSMPVPAETSQQSNLIKPREAAQFLAISERSLWGLTKRAEVPSVKIGRCVRYRRSDLENFVSTRAALIKGAE